MGDPTVGLARLRQFVLQVALVEETQCSIRLKLPSNAFPFRP
jgi:hypothetical protein